MSNKPYILSLIVLFDFLRKYLLLTFFYVLQHIRIVMFSSIYYNLNELINKNSEVRVFINSFLFVFVMKQSFFGRFCYHRQHKELTLVPLALFYFTLLLHSYLNPPNKTIDFLLCLLLHAKLLLLLLLEYFLSV